MIINGHEPTASNNEAGARAFTLRDHVVAQLDHLRPEERMDVLTVVAAFAHGEIEGIHLPGPEPYFRLHAPSDLLIFVERKPGAPAEVFDITRSATLRMFANAAVSE